MKIMSWNINSLRLRLPLLTTLLARNRPEIICLQETKVQDTLFPGNDLKTLGYKHLCYKGMKSYNGVCILSTLPFEIPSFNHRWCGKDDCRHIMIRFEYQKNYFHLHNFYVPAGGDVPDPQLNPKFKHKLNFIDEATEWFKLNPQENTILVGDLNIAPLEHDVWNHKQLLNVVSHTPIETNKLLNWMNTGFTDAVRTCILPPEKIYTWWSYRNRDWEKSNRGRRLDHLWISNNLKPSLKAIEIYKEVRNWKRPSDHVPITLEIDL